LERAQQDFVADRDRLFETGHLKFHSVEAGRGDGLEP
jgi:hypothetical protein